jgi:hypothetical protein
MARKPNRFNFDHSFAFENAEGEEIEVEVSAHVEEYHAAKLHGPPEDCYPAEGGNCDDWQIFLDGKPITDDAFEALGGNLDDLRESIEVAAAEYEPDVPDCDDRDDYDRDCDFEDSSRDP